MQVVAEVLVGALAALHVYILVLEMFLWQRPRGRAAFGMDEETARNTASMAANQGLYNGFLAAGLIWGLLAADPVDFQAQVFFASCVVVAGAYGAASTSSRKILLSQFAPGVLTLAAVLLAG
ncbi:DUF1304 domain-containing protein [Streptomyces sp. NPDC006012]|uniref:DUF1304 domain-containing protein n=1 Tax=Streptomyces sp. NPDC006012 TaxID=3364739 RepID=UPI0036A67327